MLSKADPGLVSQLGQALAASSSESLRLLSHIPGVEPVDNDPNNIPRSSLPLLKQILLANSMAFKGDNQRVMMYNEEEEEEEEEDADADISSEADIAYNEFGLVFLAVSLFVSACVFI